MNQREVMELIRDSKTLTALTKALKQSDADTALYNWAMRYFLDVRARERGVPLKGTFEITPLCNLDCRMCYVHLNAEQLRGQKLLPAEKWEQIMSEAIDAGMMYACLTGGECLTSPDFDRLYLFLHSRGVQVSILTNAVLLDEKRVEFFVKHPPSAIQFTLYGMDEETYERVTGRREFGRVMENIRRADAAGLPLVMSITPNEYLGADDEKLVRFAAETGVPFHINSSLMTPREETGRADGFRDLTVDDYMRLFRLEISLKGELPPPECAEELPETGGENTETPKGLRCGGGRSGFNVTWDGEVIPCNRLRDISAKPLEVGFAGAWREVNRRVNEYLLPCECETCPYKAAAKPCAAAHGGDGHAKPEQCEWCRAMAKAGFAKVK